MKKPVIQNADGSIGIMVLNDEEGNLFTPMMEWETEEQYLARVVAQETAKWHPTMQAGIAFAGAVESWEVPDGKDPVTKQPVEEYFYENGVAVKKPSPAQGRAFRNQWRWDPAAKKIVVDPALETEERWQRVREIRNRLLADSDIDYTRESEAAGPRLAAIKQYRQALRDLPQAHADPKNINWPTKP